MTKQEFLEFICPAEGLDGYIRFEMAVDFVNLCWANGMEFMNDEVADFVDDGHLLSDLSFDALRVESGDIIVQVTACAKEWNEEFSEEQ